MFWILLQSAASTSTTPFFATLALSLSLFSPGSSNYVLPIKSSGSNSDIGLMIDGSASSCLDLIKTVGTLQISFLDVLGSPPSH